MLIYEIQVLLRQLFTCNIIVINLDESVNAIKEKLEYFSCVNER